MKLRKLANVDNLTGKKVLVRLELDVPIKDGKITDDFRVRSSLKTLKYLRDKGAKIIIISHIGRDPKNTLKPVYDYLNKLFPLSSFITDYFSSETKAIIEKLPIGGALFFENLRVHPEEEENNEEFARKLASLADIYVNEAFAVSHRRHASIV